MTNNQTHLQRKLSSVVLCEETTPEEGAVITVRPLRIPQTPKDSGRG